MFPITYEDNRFVDHIRAIKAYCKLQNNCEGCPAYEIFRYPDDLYPDKETNKDTCPLTTCTPDLWVLPGEEGPWMNGINWTGDKNTFWEAVLNAKNNP